jgi:aminopeptidase 2
MGQMSLLGASVALLLLINNMGANVIPRRELHLNSDRYSESSGARAAGEEYRLPLTVTPEKYTITLTPNYTDFATFIGEVEILVTAKTAGNNISLHYDNMTIESRSVTELDGTELVLDGDNDYSYDKTTNIYTLTLSNQNLVLGTQYKINIKYRGHLLDDMAGFYRSFYTTADGETR